MDNFSIEAFFKIYEKNKRIDYIISCTSEWHLMSAMAFIRFLYKKEQRRLSGILIICEHSTNGYLIQDSLLQLPEYFGTVIYKRDKSAIVDYRSEVWEGTGKLCQESCLYIVSVLKPWLKMSLECRKFFQCKIVNVLIDEGVGCYVNIFKRSLEEYQECRNLRGTVRNFCLEVFSYGILPLIHIPVRKYLLLEKRRRKYISNMSAAESYQEIVGILPKQEIIFQPKQPYALLLVQPLKEQGCSNVNAVLSCFEELKRRCERVGIELYVKLHPRYTGEEYYDRGFSVVEDRIGVENLLSSIDKKPEFVCGFASTALVTSCLLYGIHSYSLSALLLADKEIGNKYFRNILREYDKNFSKIVPEFSYHLLSEYGD